MIPPVQVAENPIPAFDQNKVLPPFISSPAEAVESPYKCSTLELCQRFAYNRKRKLILEGFLGFRRRLNEYQIVQGVQWLDGSFVEDKENDKRADVPGDIDVLTLFGGVGVENGERIIAEFPAFIYNDLSKTHFLVDHFPIRIDSTPMATVNQLKYWLQLFTHQKETLVWKGIVEVPLNTPDVDETALQYLTTLAV